MSLSSVRKFLVVSENLAQPFLILGIVTVNIDAMVMVMVMVIICHCHPDHHHDHHRDEEGPSCVTVPLAPSQCQLHLLQLILILASMLMKMIFSDQFSLLTFSLPKMCLRTVVPWMAPIGRLMAGPAILKMHSGEKPKQLYKRGDIWMGRVGGSQ